MQMLLRHTPCDLESCLCWPARWHITLFRSLYCLTCAILMLLSMQDHQLQRPA